MSLCNTGKVPYATRRHLKRYLRSKGLQKNRVYRCPDCHMFHHSSANHRATAWFRENT